MVIEKRLADIFFRLGIHAGKITYDDITSIPVRSQSSTPPRPSNEVFCDLCVLSACVGVLEFIWKFAQEKFVPGMMYTVILSEECPPHGLVYVEVGKCKREYLECSEGTVQHKVCGDDQVFHGMHCQSKHLVEECSAVKPVKVYEGESLRSTWHRFCTFSAGFHFRMR